MAVETWETTEKIYAALDRFESAIDGWRRPAAYGILRGDGGVPDPVRVNLNEHMLPAAIAATVCGYSTGTASYVISEAELDRIIALLEPAGACPDFDHPNLAAFHRVREHRSPGEEVAMVFVDDLDAETDDAYVAATIRAALAGRTENADGTTTLWRPTGPTELALVEENGRRSWPPRLPDQPIFYPVLNEDYAVRIARDWNVPASGSGFVTRFRVDTPYARTLPTQRAGGSDKLELWVPAEDLDEFNAHIVGTIEVTRRFEG